MIVYILVETEYANWTTNATTYSTKHKAQAAMQQRFEETCEELGFDLTVRDDLYGIYPDFAEAKDDQHLYEWQICASTIE